MRVLNLSFILLVALAAISFSQNTKSNRFAEFDKLSFSVELDRRSYLPYQPLYSKFQITNKTATSVSVACPQFLLDTSARIVHPSGKELQINRLSTASGRSVDLPEATPILRPGQSCREAHFLEIAPEVFSAPGSYRVQFVLYTPDGGTKAIESEVVAFTVEKPQGLDHDAFDYLSRNGMDVWFGEVFLRRRELESLTAFVNNFGASRYGPYSVLSLGKFYLYAGELDRAQFEFEKIKSSESKYFSDVASKALADIAKKRNGLEKQGKLRCPIRGVAETYN